MHPKKPNQTSSKKRKRDFKPTALLTEGVIAHWPMESADSKDWGATKMLPNTSWSSAQYGNSSQRSFVSFLEKWCKQRDLLHFSMAIG
jgi:hypothetical protein